MARPGGSLIITGESGRAFERDTYNCCHCQKICLIQPGSGKTRGFCMKCMKPTCGKEKCCRCIPFERGLERMESRSRLWRQMDNA